MSLLINAYCTHRDPPALGFPHKLNSRRNRTDPELLEHLNAFISFILQGGEREMTESLYHVTRHIERAQHHYSLEVDDEHLDDFAGWARSANAISFLPDNTVRDPSGGVLVDPETGEPEEGAEVPYPQDALDRRARSFQRLAEEGIEVYSELPPVTGEGEVVLRAPGEVAMRMLALFVCAIRAESLNSDRPIPIKDLRKRIPLAFEALSPKEKKFLDAASPDQQDIVNHVWRYESLLALQWALGLAGELLFPTAICDLNQVVGTILDNRTETLVREAELRPTGELLDALDLHYRLHWATTQARVNGAEIRPDLEGGVILERHYALNWLTCFEDADWDDVDTPT